jgi:hypothetical protein
MLNEIAALNEREVQAEFDTNGGERTICIYTTKMWITAEGARQLRDWLDKALADPRGHIPVSVLREHWLTGVECDHENKTDVATCYCSRWRSTPQPNIPAAVNEWIKHLLEQCPSGDELPEHVAEAFGSLQRKVFEQHEEIQRLSESLGAKSNS